MENYIVSARKYRPDTFESVVAQKSLTTTLKNAIQTGKLAHAYLFCGPRGVGKTTCARIFAKTINCEHPTATGEPCNSCESCQSFNQQRSFSIYELDAASNNSVDDIRGLNEQVRIAPQVGRYKVYIIDEVHMLSQAAFNAFLKTLEEPPAHAIFILATTEKHKIIPTILSRCQIYDFSRIENNDIIAHLKSIADREGITSEYDALRIIAQKSDGCMRDALSLFDQMTSFTQGNLTYDKVIGSLNILDYDYYFRFTEHILASQTSQLLLLFNEILNKGFEGNIIIGGLASHFRDLLVASDPATHPLLECGEELRKRYIEQATKCPPKFLFRAIKLCNDCDANYRTSRNKRLLAELTIIQLSQITTDTGDEGSGQRPIRLKPIFKAPTQQAQTPVQTEKPTVAENAAKSEAPIQQAQAPTQAEKPSPQKSIQSGVMNGRPEALKRSAENIKTPFGGMFSRTHNAAVRPVTADTTQQTEENENPAINKEKHTPLTQENLSQKWFEYALQLPPNEHALADRMKIINPEKLSDNSFVIRVDNQHVSELFAKESKSITAYIANALGCGNIVMKIEQNTQQVQRRIYNRTEQFKLLAEKNPALEKLRQNLNLDFS
ncbi:MAG: DNA polymerase III subunit gamma/tau [Bacteroidaceae bacterium]|nr:DNA polymerase III subunit gamma/tau [Bacteroidaceae bacterium]